VAQVVEVSKDEARAAVVQSDLVNLIRTKLKEKHIDHGSYIFRYDQSRFLPSTQLNGFKHIIMIRANAMARFWEC
jgi:hypothetical protein